MTLPQLSSMLWKDDISSCKSLITSGYNVDQYVNGQTLLIRAALHGAPNILLLLLKRNAKVDLKCCKGNSALHYAAKEGNNICAGFLLQEQANVDITDINKNTPLMVAAENGKLMVLAVLLKYGANVCLKNNVGDGALHLALVHWKYDCAKQLVAHGADVNAENSAKETPLHIAALLGQTDIVKQFLKVPNVDVFVKNNKGATARDMAEENGHTEIANMISELMKRNYGKKYSHNYLATHKKTVAHSFTFT